MTLNKEDILFVDDSITVWLHLKDGFCSVKLSIADFCPESFCVRNSRGKLHGIKLDSLSSYEFGKCLFEVLCKEFNLV